MLKSKNYIISSITFYYLALLILLSGVTAEANNYNLYYPHPLENNRLHFDKNMEKLSAHQVDDSLLNAQLKLVDSLQHKNVKYELAIEYLELSTLYRKKLKFGKARQLLDSTLFIMQDLNRADGIADALSAIGMFYWRTSKFDSAIIYMERGISLYKEIGDIKNYAIDLNSLGSSYYQIGMYDKALSNYIESNRLRKELNDYSGISKTYNNIGMIYRDLSYFDQARDYFTKGLQWAKTSEDSDVIAYSYNNVGSLHESEGNLDSALYYYLKSFETYKDDGYSIGILNQKNIGRVFLAKGEFTKAQNYLENALELTVLINDRTSQAEVYKYLAMLYAETGNFKKGISFAQFSLEISTDIGRKEFIKDNYKILSDIYAGMGDKVKALDYYKKYHLSYTSLFNQEVGKKISVLEEQKEIEQQKLELSLRELKIKNEEFYRNFIGAIALALLIIVSVLYLFNRKIKRSNTQLKEKNKQIEAQKKELDDHVLHLKQLGDTQNKLFSILAHDLRNPFHSMLGYSDLLIDDFSDTSEEEKLKYIKTLRSSLNSTYNLLVNLLMWSQANTGSLETRPEKFDFNEVVHKTLDILKPQYLQKKIEIIYEKEVPANVFADKNMIEIVLRNLLTNAIKYSNNNGRIWLSMKTDNDYLTCSVKDEGIGIDEKLADNLFKFGNQNTRSGTAGEKGSGLGLILCKEFVELNKGQIFAKSKVNEGSEFIIEIPLAPID